MGKYEPLRDYLSSRSGDEEAMTFGQLERLVGPLPDSAREHRAWWGNDDYKSQSQAWRAAGWHVASVNQPSGQVVFARGIQGGTSGLKRRAPAPERSYIDALVIAAIKAKAGTDRFDRSKLLRLIEESQCKLTAASLEVLLSATVAALPKALVITTHHELADPPVSANIPS